MPLTRRYFLRLASLGTGLAFLSPRLLVRVGSQAIVLVPHAADGRFSLLLSNTPLVSRFWLELQTNRGVLSSRNATLHISAADPEHLLFRSSSPPLDVIVSAAPAAMNSGLTLAWSVRNRDAAPIRVESLSLIASQDDGGGLTFCDRWEDGRLLTDEWERCYGEAKVIPLAEVPSFHSAWDFHLFDTRRGRTLSCSYFDVPPGMLAFNGHTTRGNGAVDLAVRLSTKAGEEGVFVDRDTTFNAGSLLFLVREGPPVDALIDYAQGIAERNGVTVSGRVPTGWVDWYFAKGNIRGEDIVQNIDLIAQQLHDFGLQYIQIDSGWQLGIEASPPPDNVVAGGPWVPNRKFDRGMAWYAARIREKGFAPGLWIRPFQEISSAPDRSAHPMWFNEKGQMDISNTEVRQRVRELCDTVTREWDYAYVKYDFVAYDTFNEWGPKLFDDHAAVKQPAQQSETSIAAYRAVMQDIRSATEERARLLSCNGLMPQTLGVADAFRIGDDVGDWERTFRNGVKSISARFYTNGIYWWNDPDCLLVREPFTLDQARAWASLIAQTGGIVFISEDLRVLPQERLAIIKKVLPVYSPESGRYHWARPMDFLENSPPEIWVLTVKKSFAEWVVAGIYNWSAATKIKTVRRQDLGLSASEKWCASDFWKEEFLGEVGNELRFELPAWSCRLLAIHEMREHPQIVGTNRHVTQGGVELSSVQWDARQKVLSGKAEAIAGNDYTLLLRVPRPFTISAVEGIDVLSEGEIVRLKVSSPDTRTVAWRLLFR